MTDVTLPTGVTWRVRMFESDETTAGETFERVYRENTHGDFSIWRVTTPDRLRWSVVICGRPEKIAHLDFPGEIPVHPANADEFARRRARVGVDSFKENPLAEVSQVAHYEYGARIDGQGEIRPEPPPAA